MRVARFLRFMKYVLLLALMAQRFLCFAQNQSLAEMYSARGQLIVTQFASAPFPHPKRSEGHKYKEKNFPAAEHYSDSTVAIFIPKDFREEGPIDFVIH